MDNSNQITEETKNKVCADITDTLLHALENGAISADDARDASNYILERLDVLQNQIYLDAFLEESSERWPCFNPLLLTQKVKAEEKNDQQNIQNVQSEINQITQ